MMLAIAGSVGALSVLLLQKMALAPAWIDRLAWAVAIASTALYFALFEASSWKGTPGKRLLGLRVTALRGQRLTRFQSLIRVTLFAGSLMLAGVPLIVALRNKKHQTGHDLFAQSVVLRKTEDSPTVRKFKLVLPWAAAGICLGAAGVAVALWASSSPGSKANGRAEDTMARGLQTGIEFTQPMRQYIEVQMGAGRIQPDRLPEELRGAADAIPGLKVTYNSRNGSIHLHLVGGSRRTTLLLTPERNSSGVIVWRCGSSGLELDELPEFCKQKGSRSR